MIACIAASIGILAGLTGSVSENAVVGIFQRLLSCGTFKTYPPLAFLPSATSAAVNSNINMYGNSISMNTTTWCLYQAYATARYDNTASCYCSYTTFPQPLHNPSYTDSCEVLTFNKGGAHCNKIFTEFTPTLRASAAITSLLTGM